MIKQPVLLKSLSRVIVTILQVLVSISHSVGYENSPFLGSKILVVVPHSLANAVALRELLLIFCL